MFYLFQSIWICGLFAFRWYIFINFFLCIAQLPTKQRSRIKIHLPIFFSLKKKKRTGKFAHQNHIFFKNDIFNRIKVVSMFVLAMHSAVSHGHWIHCVGQFTLSINQQRCGCGCLSQMAAGAASSAKLKEKEIRCHYVHGC